MSNTIFIFVAVAAGVISTSPSMEASFVSSFEFRPTTQGSHQMDLLKIYLARIHDVYVSDAVYYAPFVPLIQSSGYGKSKICFELLRECPGIPIVCRNAGTGYPPEKGWMRSFFEFVFNQPNTYDDLPISDTMFPNEMAVHYTPSRVLIALETLLTAYIAWFERLRRTQSVQEAIETMGNHFISENPNWCDDEGIKIQFDLFDGRSIAVVIRSVKILINNFVERCGSQVSVVDEPTSVEFSLKLPFMFVFDEIGDFNFVSSVRPDQVRVPAVNIIRRGLHVLDSSTDLLAIALGTNTDIVTFMPTVRNNSLRILKRVNLLPPLILSRNFDIFLEQAEWPVLELTQAHLLNSKMFNLLVSMGRPLWSASKLSTVVSVATEKTGNSEKDSGVDFLTTWLIRCSLNINHSHVVARALVNSHMATVYGVSSDGRALKVKYPSDPILGLAARHFLLSAGSNKLAGRLRAFEHLFNFIGQRAVDKGRFAEVIFEQIVLFSIDDAKPATLLPINSEILCQNTLLQSIFDAENYILEVMKPVQAPLPSQHRPEPSTQEQLSEELSEKDWNMEFEPKEEEAPEKRTTDKSKFYKVVLIRDLLRSLFNCRGLEFILEKTSSVIMESITNASHFVTLGRDRQGILQRWGGEGFMKLRPANSFTKDCDVLDRALLKIGLIRQCAFVMPVNYYGTDFMLPYCMKEYPEPDEIEPTRPLYSCIPCQVKAGNTSIHDAVVKMALQFHFCKCYNHVDCSAASCPGRTSESEMKKICENQLSMLFCGDLDFPFRTEDDQVFYAISNLDSNSEIVALGHVHRIFEADLISTFKFDFPSFSKSKSLKNADEAPDLIIYKSVSSTLAVEIMKWYTRGNNFTMTCIISSNLSTFNHVIGERSIDVAYNIINYDSNIFDDVDDIHMPLTIDAVLNSSFADFPAVDRQLTLARGQVPPYTDVPGDVSYFNKHNLNSSVQKCIKRNF